MDPFDVGELVPRLAVDAGTRAGLQRTVRGCLRGDAAGRPLPRDCEALMLELHWRLDPIPGRFDADRVGVLLCVIGFYGPLQSKEGSSPNQQMTALAAQRDTPTRDAVVKKARALEAAGTPRRDWARLIEESGITDARNARRILADADLRAAGIDDPRVWRQIPVLDGATPQRPPRSGTKKRNGR